ncbi:hypothetical protein FKM82_030719 [Ascaphus truei]
MLAPLPRLHGCFPSTSHSAAGISAAAAAATATRGGGVSAGKQHCHHQKQQLHCAWCSKQNTAITRIGEAPKRTRASGTPCNNPARRESSSSS